MTLPNPSEQDPDLIRPHIYDGIQEYNKRLPNWWLFTLYGAMAFAFVYWAYYHWTSPMEPGYLRVDREIEKIQQEATANFKAPDDAKLWSLSTNPVAVASGQKIYQANCVACHGANLQGGIGQNLVDNVWIHGSNPTDIYATIEKGVLQKGMPVWGPVLGGPRISEVAAFIISKNSYLKKPSGN